MPNDPPAISPWKRVRFGDWWIHVLVYCLSASAYAVSFAQIPVGFRDSFLFLLILQFLFYPGAYLLNDFADYQSDALKRQKSVRHRPSLPITIALLGLSILWTCLSVDVTAVVVTVLTVVAGMAYSIPPVRSKARGFAGVATAALTQRFPFFVILVFRHPVQWPPAFFVGGYLVCTGVLFILHHQFEDMEFDRITGIRTWGVRVGRVRLGRSMHYCEALLVLGSVSAWLATIPQFALAFMLLTLLTLGLFRIRHNRRARARSLKEIQPPMNIIRQTAPREVRIVGAGLAGMMAGIKLVDSGVEVQVETPARRPGATNGETEQIHFTHVDPELLATYCGFSLETAFTSLETEEGYWRGRRYLRRTRSIWACRRGSSEGTIDRLLHDALLRRGVTMIAAPSQRPPGPETTPLIIATGLSLESYARLGLPHRIVRGCQAMVRNAGGEYAVHYREPLLGKDFGYIACCGGRGYATVFSRDGLPTTAPERLAELIREGLAVEVEPWTPFEGAIPLRPQLFSDGIVLAGMISGSFDPYYLSGIAGALVSGRIAAHWMLQPDRGADEFQWVTRNWRVKSALSNFAQRHNTHLPAYLVTAAMNTSLPTVGES